MLVDGAMLFESAVNRNVPPAPGPFTDGSVQAVNRATGAVLWRSTGHAYLDMARVGQTLYVNAVDGLYAFDTQTGNTLWSHNFDAAVASVATMSQQGTTRYLANGQTLYALDGFTHNVL